MIALVDCNNFYTSCERSFNPALNGKPIVVLSNNDGCVISRSNEAKAIIPMGAPAYQYQEIFKRHNIHVFSSNYPLYGDMSQRVMNTLKIFTPEVEIYSIDEAFLNLSGLGDKNWQEYGLQIQETVKKITRIPVSIGIAPTRALGKVANKIAKQFHAKTGGVYLISSNEQRLKALKWTKIEDVWGIGRRLSKKLKAMGIFTAFEFTQLSDDFIKQNFSIIELRLKKELEGIPMPVIEKLETKKSIAITRTFEHAINDFEQLKERIFTFSSVCAKKLRQQKTKCQFITVFIRTNTHNKNFAQYGNGTVISLPFATNSSIILSKQALKALEIIYKPNFKYKRAGVVVSGIQAENTEQLNIFEQENPKHKEIMQALDHINHKFGSNTLKLATQNPKQTWIMRQEHLSPRYTTDWDELLEVK